MLKKTIYFLLAIIITSCGSQRDFAINEKGKATSYREEISKTAQKVTDYALQFQGVKYKYGGTNKKGMDCSGLVYTSFLSENIELPRISRDMAKQGMAIRTQDIKVGDLVFFSTSRSSNRINHVGLVVEILPGSVNFIHSTSSLGVIVSSLNEKYWNAAYVTARRIL
ncbi:C40 family peptidase [Mesonia sp. K7]|uniref:C40 family peptidase n=1 Tax=Mesonia sp. K7 TaxID=2218606 RepID=UPI000DA9BDBB|nr:C40 family peptidase [Mesonia sp. K7]PZD77767.1 NlpC/P60 family protein [Mesonia sp. K7]